MRRWIVVAVMLICGTAAARPHRWTVTPPAGWTDMTSTFDATPAAKDMRAGIEDFGGTATLAVYGDGAGAALIIVDASQPIADPYSFEGGVRNGMSKDGKELAYRSWRDGDTLAAEQTVEKNGTHMYGKRYIGQISGDTLVAVTATCIGPEAACKAALATLAIDRSDLVELEEKTDFNAAVYVMGGITVGVLVIAIVIGVMRRKRKA